MGRPKEDLDAFGPQGAGRIEPLRGEHARPFFFKYGLVGNFKISRKFMKQ